MRVALFATCLVDLFRPNVGFAAIKLLQDAGCQVDVPPQQTCCGQPAYNNGDLKNARRIARQVIDTFYDYDHIVVPSGSCGGMLSRHYPDLFDNDPEYRAKADNLAARCHELMSFLVDVLQVKKVDARYDGNVTYHDSCSSLRELAVHDQPRNLLQTVTGLNLIEMDDTETCCGFGGTFSVKYPDIAGRIVSDKVEHAAATHADTLLSADIGCLLNIAGRSKRLHKTIRFFHVAEVLAGMAEGPGIGDGDGDVT